jgi:hypothetical protein
LDKITEESLKALMDRISSLEEQTKYMFLQPQGSKISIGAHVFGNMKDTSETTVPWQPNLENTTDNIYHMLLSHYRFTVPEGWIMNIELITNLKVNNNNCFDDIGTDTIGIFSEKAEIVKDLINGKDDLDTNPNVFILASSHGNYAYFAKKKI